MSIAARNLAWADALVAGLTAAGLSHVAIGPGARCAPLTAAFLRRPEVDCHVINDERAAGFFALGIGKASGRPAAVLTTSGSAAANLLPAVMEANLADVPLIVLTADRPPEAHGWGANQSVDQTKLFGSQVRAFHALPEPTPEVPTRFLTTLAARLIADSLSPIPGPVHANVPLREPLLPEKLAAPPPLPERIACPLPAAALPADIEAIAARLSGKPGVIVCGAARYPEGFAAAVTRLAARCAAPLIADVLSNLRHGPHDRSHLIAHATHLLGGTPLPAPHWVLRFGAFPLARAVERWLDGLSATEHLIVAAPGRWPDPLWRSRILLQAHPTLLASELAAHCRPAAAEFCAAWQDAERHAMRGELPFCEGSVARALLAALPEKSHVFVGNSLAIRALDAFGGTSEKSLTFHGNRGASGIDGNLATAAGIAAATGKRIAVLVGDQTLLHDSNSLALLAAGDHLIVVLDNGGGGIFAHLPFAAFLPPELLRRGWTAPPYVAFNALASAYGLRYAEAQDAAGFATALARALTQGGAWLVRAVIDPSASRVQFS